MPNDGTARVTKRASYEKGQGQLFWGDLLTKVFGVDDLTSFVRYEDQVKSDTSTTNFIDVRIPSTKVFIEQKSINKDLRAPIKQSDGNYGNWKSCYKYLQVYCSENTTFGDITPRWVQGFKSYLETVEKDTTKMTLKPREGFNGLSQNSKCSYFNKLRACLNQAYREGIIPSNPADPVKGFKADEAERQYLTIDEVKRMADTYCKYPHLKRAFLFGCFTGLRKSDIEKLTWGEVQRFGGYTRLVFKQKKTGGQEYLDIPKVAEPYLGKQGDKTSEDLVFPLFKYSSETSLELRRWALAAGITKDFTFHCSRHTFAVMLLNSGTDIYTVSKLLGHREIATTQIYAHLVDSRKQEAVDKISDIFNDL